MAEEAIAALYIIAGYVAWTHGHRAFGWVLFCKGILDSVCAFTLAVREAYAEVKNRQDGGAEQPCRNMSCDLRGRCEPDGCESRKGGE